MKASGTRTKLLALTLAAAALVLPAKAFAGSENTTMTVSAGVIANCTISTATVALGNYDPVVANASTAKTGTGSVTVTCTQDAVPIISLSTGANAANATGTTRAMKNGTANYLSYELYQESGMTTVWGDTGDARLTLAAAPSTAPRTSTVYGRIPAGQDKPVGAYTDTVTATVDF